MPDHRAELVFGFVYAVGTDADPVVRLLKEYLRQFGYAAHEFRVSEHLRTLNLRITFNPSSRFEEMSALMNAGNRARDLSSADDILAVMAVNDIADRREDGQPLDRMAHLIRSLKRPEEVRRLREVYRPGFFLIAIASDDEEQHRYLTDVRGLTRGEADIAISRDQDEGLLHGQRTRDTFYLADVFVELTGERYKKQLERFLELVFGHPFQTPTREEHAMFVAYASAARSAQFGRQVGASVATVAGDVVAMGFNEVPAPSGGAYWGGDSNDARDHAYDRKVDSNFVHRSRIVNSIVTSLHEMRGVMVSREDPGHPGVQADSANRGGAPWHDVSDDELRKSIHSSELKEITEYGRAVHAEMDALLTCARLGISVKGKRLFTTTFPCHNCTRHIVAAGVSAVTYIEPYPKSRAADLHRDAICFDAEEAKKSGKIPFLPFVGIGPRRYLDLFSTDLSTGSPIVRKDEHYMAVFPQRAGRTPRVPMLPYSYVDRENKLLQEYADVIRKLEGDGHE